MSLPTSTIEMDLNGTGVLIDVSADVDDMQAVTHQWGRTDWTSDAPNPGTLTFTLANTDGRYTPGNTAMYAVGPVPGVRVVWTVGGRVRSYKCGTPSVQWANANANSSTVTVTCTDLLGDAAQRTLRTMLDEEVLSRQPLWYWRLDDSGDGLDPRPQDSSGSGGPALIPYGAPGDYSWAQNSGPRADAGGGLGLNQSLADGAFVYNLIATPCSYLSATPAQSAAVVGGSVSVAFAFSPIPLVDEQLILALDFGTSVIGVAWRSDLGIRIQQGITIGGTDGPLILAGLPRVTNVAFLTLAYDGSNINWSMSMNGGAPVAGAAYACTDIPAVIKGVYVGGGQPTWWNGALDGYAGAISRVAVWATSVTPVGDLYTVGQLGAPELPSARVSRLASYLGATSTASGADRGDLVGQQDTSGQSALAAMCDALRGEDAAIIDAGGHFEPWLYSEQRPSSSSLTIDLDADHASVPDFSFDTSGVVNTVTVTSHSVSVTFRTSAPGRYVDSSTTLDSGLVSQAAALNLAQYRTTLGRITQAAPSSVSVDLATAVNAATLAPQLLALRPGSRITIDNCPSGILGYSSIDAIVVGAAETYTADSAVFTLRLQPLWSGTPAFVLEDTATGRLDTTDVNVVTRGGITSTAMSVSIFIDGVTHFSAADVPYDIQIGAEQMTVTAVTTYASYDTLTVTRGVNGTTAASHSPGERAYVVGTGVLVY